MAGKRYKTSDKMLLGIFSLTQVLTLALGISLLFFPDFCLAALIALVVRLIILTITTHVVSKKLSNPMELLPIAFLDFLYMIYYLSTGLVALLTNRVKWTN